MQKIYDFSWLGLSWRQCCGRYFHYYIRNDLHCIQARDPTPASRPNVIYVYIHGQVDTSCIYFLFVQFLLRTPSVSCTLLPLWLWRRYSSCVLGLPRTLSPRFFLHFWFFFLSLSFFFVNKHYSLYLSKDMNPFLFFTFSVILFFFDFSICFRPFRANSLCDCSTLTCGVSLQSSWLGLFVCNIFTVNSESGAQPLWVLKEALSLFLLQADDICLCLSHMPAFLMIISCFRGLPSLVAFENGALVCYVHCNLWVCFHVHSFSFSFSSSWVSPYHPPIVFGHNFIRDGNPIPKCVALALSLAFSLSLYLMCMYIRLRITATSNDLTSYRLVSILSLHRSFGLRLRLHVFGDQIPSLCTLTLQTLGICQQDIR